MCGIAGLLHFQGRPIESELLGRACLEMRHRGPDDHGIWTHSSAELAVGLAAVRLAVIDPSPGGHQPMVSAEGRFVLVFNGEVYNHPQIRSALESEGVSFRSNSDTEVVLHGLIHWGHAALGRLEGMWALAFYDRDEQVGLLARDPIGIKPLFWAGHGPWLGFASEIRALKALHEWPEDINPAALIHYLRYGYIPHPHTIYATVHNLPPGMFIRFGRGKKEELGRYEQHGRMCSTDRQNRDATLRKSLRETIESAVAAQRVADVPLGAFLSGGLDSSIVVYHLARCSSRPVQTFTVGFEGHRAYDERTSARETARMLGTDHHEIVVTHAEVQDAIPGLFNRMGQPFGDSSLVPTSLISRFARRQVTVALSGDGGDEVFGGYWRYLGHVSIETYRRLPSWLRHRIVEPLLGRLVHCKSGSISNRVRQLRKLLRAGDLDPFAAHAAWSRIMSPGAESIVIPSAAERRDWGVHGGTENDDLLLCALRTLLSERGREDPLNTILQFDQSHGLPADMLHKVDLASMACSLEVRVPLLDVRVIDFMNRLPSDYKVHTGIRKRLLRDAYRGHLPDSILDRPKMGFELPMGEYLRGPLRTYFLETVSRSTVESFGILDYAAVRGVYEAHCRREAEHADLLYSLLALCGWRSSV